MTYANPLHPPVPVSKTSPFNSLNGAVVCPPQPPLFLSPTQQRLPQGVYSPTSKWRNATGRLSQLHSAISFDYIGYTKQGIPVRELAGRSTLALGEMIIGAKDKILEHTGLRRISFRIMWPGYAHVEWNRSIEVSGGPEGPITRAQLGAQIALNIMRFVEKARSEACTAPEWHCGPRNIRIEHLILVGLHNVFEDVWQADIAVDLR